MSTFIVKIQKTLVNELNGLFLLFTENGEDDNFSGKIAGIHIKTYLL